MMRRFVRRGPLHRLRGDTGFRQRGFHVRGLQPRGIVFHHQAIQFLVHLHALDPVYRAGLREPRERGVIRLLPQAEMYLYPGHVLPLNRITPASRPTRSTQPANAPPAPAGPHRIPSRPLPGGAKQSTLAALPSPAEPPILRLPARSAAESPISEWPPPTTPKTSFGLSFRKMIHRPRAPPQAW